MLWAILQRGKALSSRTTEDAIAYLRVNPGHTRDCTKGRRPKTTKTQKIGSWFSKRKVVTEVDVEVGCVWPAHVSTEMSLHVLAYNLKRVMKVLGFVRTMRAMRLAGA